MSTITRIPPTADVCDACERTANYIDTGFSPAMLGHRCDCGGRWRSLRWRTIDAVGESAYHATRTEALRHLREEVRP